MLSKLRHPYIFASLLYLTSILFIVPFGEFAINDDWIFVRQVEAALRDNFIMSLLVDPSFILQNLVGYAWASVFGFSFTSLRILTILLTLLLGFGVYLSSKFFKKSQSNAFVVATLLVCYFNPLVYHSSMTFMTEIYFLVCFIWSIYFYVLGFRKMSACCIFFGSFFAGCSLLVRQVGIVLFIAFFIALFLRSRQKMSFKMLVPHLVVLCFSIGIMVLWPRHVDVSMPTAVGLPGLHSLSAKLVQRNQFAFRLRLMLYSLYYLPFFSFPLILSLRLAISKKIKYVLLFISIFLAIPLYKLDIFPVGNVFYVEGFLAKSNFRSNFSIFDNVLFKSFLALLIACACVKFLYMLWTLRIKITSEILFLGLVTLGMFCILFFGNDIYDRYLLPTFFSFLLCIGIMFVGKFAFDIRRYVLGAVFLLFISVVLQHAFISQTKLLWVQAIQLQQKTGLISQIYVTGSYAKYYKAKKLEDFVGSVRTGGVTEYKCYVQQYTLDSTLPVLGSLNSLDAFLQKKISNPKIYASEKTHGLPRAKKHLDAFIYNAEYHTPLYSLVGKKVFVGSWCSD